MYKGLLVFLILCCCLSSTRGQKGGNTTEPSAAYQLIKSADILFDRGRYDSALQLAAAAAQRAMAENNQRACGWAFVKSAEILIDQRKLDRAADFAKRAGQLGEQSGDTTLVAVSIMQAGQVELYHNNADEAILLLDKSIKRGLGRKSNDYLGLALNDLGFAWGMKDDLERQAEFTLKSLNIFETIRNEQGAALAMINLSTVYWQMGNYRKAIEYGLKSFQLREKSGDPARLATCACNLAQYYIKDNLDEAVRYRQRCIQYAAATGENRYLINAYITSAQVSNALKNNKEAFEQELKAINLLERSQGDNRMLARRYIAAAFYSDILKYDSVQTQAYFDKSIRLSRQSNDKENLRDAYLYLSEYQARQKNFTEAYPNFKKFITYRDSILNKEKEARIAELESNYESVQKDNEIRRLNNEQQIKQLEIEKQRATIAGNKALALQKQNEIDLLSKSRELQQSQLLRQKEELEKQQLLASNVAQQLASRSKENLLKEQAIRNEKRTRNLLVAALVLVLLLGFTYFNRYQLKRKLEQQSAMLEMRNHISRDLHDDIGASLSNINILNELARRNLKDPGKSTAYLARASEDIQRISESLSDIVWNINPRFDDANSLFVRMKRYAADMLDGKNIEGLFEFPDGAATVNLSMTQRRDLYLVFKEAVNNLVKYSGATKAFIKVQVTDSGLLILVQDNGKGFDPAAPRAGNGLQNMQQRAALANASITIKSAPGTGTTVQVFLQKMAAITQKGNTR